ncbi:MAG: hypothetical protein ACJ8FY_09730 [Gemmataceae bacterium]
MISDVLSQAVDDINDYLAADVMYQGITGPINKLVLLMDAARISLDAPPLGTDDEYQAVWRAIAALDIQPVLSAVTKLSAAASSQKGTP